MTITHELQWGRNLTVAEGGRSTFDEQIAEASMGPQLDSCGRRRDLANVCQHLVASMGPQLDSCGR